MPGGRPAGGEVCFGLVTFVLLLAYSSRIVCGKSGSNLTPSSAFFASSACGRVSKVTKPTGCNENRVISSQFPARFALTVSAHNDFKTRHVPKPITGKVADAGRCQYKSPWAELSQVSLALSVAPGNTKTVSVSIISNAHSIKAVTTKLIKRMKGGKGSKTSLFNVYL